MKTITFITMGMLIFSSQFAQSQIKLDTTNECLKATGLNNIVELRYYYYPNLQTYYDTQKGLYISCEKGNWVTSEFLDLNSHGYCIKNGNYKMINGYTGDEPYTLLKDHKLQYPADYSSKPTRKLIAAAD